MAPRARDGGPGCRCPGPASCKEPAACCKRPGALGPARAVRPNGAVTKTRCLSCAGLGRLARARKRPAAAAAVGAPVAAKAKAAPKAKAVPKAKAKAAAQPPTLTDAAARELAAALDRNAAATLGFTRAVESFTRALGAQALVAAPTAATQGASSCADQGDPPDCPECMRPLRAVLGASFATPRPTSARLVLRSAGLSPSCTKAWVQLRALVVAFHPRQAARLADLELVLPEERGRRREQSAAGKRTAEMWASYGSGQMPTVMMTRDVAYATVLNHVARYLLANEALRQRYQRRLLADAAALQA
jgi:hypothetical protein